MLRQRNFVGNPQRDEVLRIVLLLLIRWQEAFRYRWAWKRLLFKIKSSAYP